MAFQSVGAMCPLQAWLPYPLGLGTLYWYCVSLTLKDFSASVFGGFNVSNSILLEKVDWGHDVSCHFAHGGQGSHKKGPVSHTQKAATEPKITLYFPNSKPRIAAQAALLNFI